MRYLKKFNESSKEEELKLELKSELSFILDKGFDLEIWENPALFEIELSGKDDSNIKLNDIRYDLLSFIDYKKDLLGKYNGTDIIRIEFKDNEWLDLSYDALESEEILLIRKNGFINLDVYRNKIIKDLYFNMKK